MKPADVTEADRNTRTELFKTIIEHLEKPANGSISIDAAHAAIDSIIAAHRIAAYEVGRVAGLEEAAKVLWDRKRHLAARDIEAIRALKEKIDG